MPCILILITFSMSMLSFIEDNKRNEHGIRDLGIPLGSHKIQTKGVLKLIV